MLCLLLLFASLCLAMVSPSSQHWRIEGILAQRSQRNNSPPILRPSAASPLFMFQGPQAPGPSDAQATFKATAALTIRAFHGDVPLILRNSTVIQVAARCCRWVWILLFVVIKHQSWLGHGAIDCLFLSC